LEEYRHSIHQSNGSVETAEYKDIQDHLAATELLKKETTDALRAKEEHAGKQDSELAKNTELLSTPPDLGESSSRADASAGVGSGAMQPGSVPLADPNETPEQHLAALRRETQRLVKKPGAPLKSAPFHSASTLKSLEPGTEVLVEILSPYWLGVETHEGDHGWIRRDELEQLP
jgi:hypothetical protein